MNRNVSRWPPFAVTSLGTNLLGLRELTLDDQKTLAPEIRGWLARLLVVRAAGYIEQTVSECCRGHVLVRGGGWVQSFAHSWLERGRNPTPESLIQLVGRFDQSASDELDQFLRADDELLYRALSSLVDKRNKIAHGLNEGVGPEQAVTLSKAAVTIADWFILAFNPHK